MDEAMTYRLVGAIVLIACSAIVLPVIFTNEAAPKTPSITRHAVPHSAKVAPHHSRKTKVVKSAWMVQIGSFANHKSAAALKRRLARLGFRVRSYQTNNAHGVRLTRIFIGPIENRTTADATIKRLHQRARLKGIIVHYKSDAG